MSNSPHLCDNLVAAASDAIAAGVTPPLFIYNGTTITAVQALHTVLSLADTLISHHNLQVGDRVCIVGQTTPTTLLSMLAITAAGGIATPLNTRWTSTEMSHGIATVDAAIVLTDAVHKDTVLAAVHSSSNSMTMGTNLIKRPAVLILDTIDGRTVCDAVDLYPGKTCGGSAASKSAQSIESPSRLTIPPKYKSLSSISFKRPEDDAAFIIFTSGTTGNPKAAVLSHRALHFQCQQKLAMCGYSRNDVYLHTAAFFHVGGLCSALAMLMAGAQHVFMPTFAADKALRIVEEQHVTSFIAVPTMITDLVSAATGATTHYTCVRTILIGAGGLEPTLLDRLTALFPCAAVHAAYGMTEAASSITFKPLNQRALPQTPQTTTSINNITLGREYRRLQTNLSLSIEPIKPIHVHRKAGNHREVVPVKGGVYVGTAPPGIELAILKTSNTTASTEEESRNIVESQGSGEVLTRGLHVMSKYWKDSVATASVLLPGGWLRTGDLGHLEPDGSLWLLGRAKDVIKTGGENVNASEVERTLLSHPAVHAACVVGIPDLRLGEVVAAVVVLANNQDSSLSSSMERGWLWQDSDVQILLPRPKAAPSNAASNATSFLLKTLPHQTQQELLKNSSLLDEEAPRDVDDVDNLRSTGLGSSSNRALVINGSVLQGYCRQAGLGGFKVPRVFWKTDCLAVNSTGKVVKSAVRNELLQLLQREKEQQRVVQSPHSKL